MSSSVVADAHTIFRAAVHRVRADRLLQEADPSDWAPEPVDAYDRIVVVGMGKAAMAMAGIAEEIWGDRITGGTVVVPSGYPGTLPDDLPAPLQVEVVTGGHPEPTAASVRAGRALLQHAEGAEANDLVLVLISGGGTALSTVPAGDLVVEDIAHVSRRLLRAGVPIHDVNVVRKLKMSYSREEIEEKIKLTINKSD